MRGFLDVLERSGRKHRPEKMNDFRKALKHVAEHAGERYFILKAIVVNNLYGVDIMEEAVEICKLRLFLKLVAQLESYEQIEPLPDIDFNVRAGNTLVGFTSLEEVHRAVAGDWIRKQSLPGIEERAENVDSQLAILQGSIPKIGQITGLNVIGRIIKVEPLYKNLKTGTSRIYYHNAPQCWIRFIDFVPYFWNETGWRTNFFPG